MLRTTGEVSTYDNRPATPPHPKVSSIFGATPLRNWPTPFYFGGVTIPSLSMFFPEP